MIIDPTMVIIGGRYEIGRTFGQVLKLQGSDVRQISVAN